MCRAQLSIRSPNDSSENKKISFHRNLQCSFNLVALTTRENRDKNAAISSSFGVAHPLLYHFTQWNKMYVPLVCSMQSKSKVQLCYHKRIPFPAAFPNREKNIALRFFYCTIFVFLLAWSCIVSGTWQSKQTDRQTDRSWLLDFPHTLHHSTRRTRIGRPPSELNSMGINDARKCISRTK